MATTVKGELTGSFLVQSSGAVDITSVGAAAAINFPVTVTAMDGTLNPLDLLADTVIQVVPPATLEAVVIQSALITATNQITLRVVNGSAAPIDPASQASGAYRFLIGRR